MSSDPIFNYRIDKFIYCTCGWFMKVFRISVIGSILGLLAYGIYQGFKVGTEIEKALLLFSVGLVIYALCSSFRTWYQKQGWAEV